MSGTSGGNGEKMDASAPSATGTTAPNAAATTTTAGAVSTDMERFLRRRPGFTYLSIDIDWPANKTKALGIVLSTRVHKVIVAALKPGSVGEERLKVLDRIVAIDNVPVSDKDVAKQLMVRSSGKFTAIIERPLTPEAKAEFESKSFSHGRPAPPTAAPPAAAPTLTTSLPQQPTVAASPQLPTPSAATSTSTGGLGSNPVTGGGLTAVPTVSVLLSSVPNIAPTGGPAGKPGAGGGLTTTPTPSVMMPSVVSLAPNAGGLTTVPTSSVMLRSTTNSLGTGGPGGQPVTGGGLTMVPASSVMLPPPVDGSSSVASAATILSLTPIQAPQPIVLPPDVLEILAKHRAERSSGAFSRVPVKSIYRGNGHTPVATPTSASSASLVIRTESTEIAIVSDTDPSRKLRPVNAPRFTFVPAAAIVPRPPGLAPLGQPTPATTASPQLKPSPALPTPSLATAKPLPAAPAAPPSISPAPK